MATCVVCRLTILTNDLCKGSPYRKCDLMCGRDSGDSALVLTLLVTIKDVAEPVGRV
jgi:hypothetical protein